MAERTALCGKSGGGLGRHFRSLWDPPGGAGTHAAWLYQLEAKPQPLVWTPGEEGLDFPAKHLPPSDNHLRERGNSEPQHGSHSQRVVPCLVRGSGQDSSIFPSHSQLPGSSSHR